MKARRRSCRGNREPRPWSYPRMTKASRRWPINREGLRTDAEVAELRKRSGEGEA